MINGEDRAMPAYKIIVFSNGVKGQEDAYNDWYDNRHIQDVVAIPGILSAQRFRMVQNVGTADQVYEYCAIYDVESDDPRIILKELENRAGTELMEVSPYLDPVITGGLFEPITS